MTYPTLYKKTSTGAIQYWRIAVYETPNSGSYYDIEIEYGQVGTTSAQITSDMITKGKNVGKKNETSIFQQAHAEAQAKWEKQKKKGYVETLDAAKADQTDDLIEGGVIPMLAHKFSDHAHKITYPCHVQPKLDGIRCIAIKKGDEVTLWSRTRKRITSCPHIEDAIRTMWKGMDELTLDGELYNHSYKNEFEKIVSAVRVEEPSENSKLVQYHIYDMVPTVKLNFAQRSDFLNKTIKNDDFIKKVETVHALIEDGVRHFFDLYRNIGYEGVMVRNSHGLYVNKRSYDLQKVKEFDDAEFEIIGAEEGRGRLQGHVGAFVCKDSQGRQFSAKMSGDTSKLAEYFRNPSTYLGKMLTVQYQGLTGKEGIPRFPVGIRIRGEE